MSKKNSWKNQTKLLHSGTLRSQFHENSESLFLTQSYRYESPESALARFAEQEEGYIYSRYGNPTVSMFEQRLASIENAEDAFATTSGMSSAFAALACQLNSGDHIVAARALFSSCLYIIDTLLPKWGIEFTLVDGSDLSQWQEAIQPNTKVFFGEIMSNPRLEILDVPKISQIARSHNICFVVDNVFATPVLGSTLDLGADVIFYSATKHIDGQGRVLGGVVLGKKDFIRGPLETFCRHTGPTLSAFNAWTLLKSLETLNIRVQQQCSSAQKTAEMLEGHSKIKKVFYPGLKSHVQHELAEKLFSRFGTMIAFEVMGDQEGAFRFLNNLNFIGLSNNLGDAKTLMTHPATTTHFKLDEKQKEELGISPGLIRLSIGLEDPEDIMHEIDQALKF